MLYEQPRRPQLDRDSPFASYAPTLAPDVDEKNKENDPPLDDKEKALSSAGCGTQPPTLPPDLFADPLAPYPDGGRGWLVVLGVSLISSSTIGFGLTWGVFQSYYTEHILVGTSTSVLSLLGGIPGLVMMILSIFVGKLGDQYGYKPFLASGCILWVVSMTLIAFSTKLWHFFLTQGLLQGMACGLVFPLLVALPSQWFFHHRALASGIVLASSSFGGAVFSTLIRALLTSLGLRKTMGVKTGIDIVVCSIGYLLLKERKPPGRGREKIIWMDKVYLKDGVFWSLAMCLFFCCLGYLTPMFFMTQFTVQKVPGIHSILSVLPLTIMNVAAGVGRIFIGYTADQFGTLNALFASVLASGLAQLLIWNFVSTYAGIMVFATIYGFFSGCFMSLSSPTAAKLYGAGRLAGLSGLLFLYVAPGQAAGATISGALFSATGDWRSVAGYAGGVQVLAALCLLYARFKTEPRILAVF